MLRRVLVGQKSEGVESARKKSVASDGLHKHADRLIPASWLPSRLGGWAILALAATAPTTDGRQRREGHRWVTCPRYGGR